MLKDRDAVATLAVRDLSVAGKFYRETLGLEQVATQDEVITLRSGKTTINVYRSEYAGTNRATAISWTVEELDTVARFVPRQEERPARLLAVALEHDR